MQQLQCVLHTDVARKLLEMMPPHLHGRSHLILSLKINIYHSPRPLWRPSQWQHCD